MTPFDLTFDRTFRPLFTDPTTPTVDGCRAEGVYLTWLTPQGGWMYWLFEGSVLRGQSTTSRGSLRQAGISRDTQRETAPTMVIHTSGLTEAEAEAVGTLRESISVWLLNHAEDGAVTPIPVSLPTGEADLWNSKTYTNSFTTTLLLPARRSQLA